MPRRPLLLASLVLAGCATARPPSAVAAAPCAAAGAPCPGAAAPVPAGAGPAQLEYEPEKVEVSRTDLELAGKNDEELFAIGQAAFSAGDYARAANAFGRLADLFPASRREAAALYDAGLAHQRLEQWRLAAERFRTLERKYEGPDALEAAFKLAECHYHLGELEAARGVLDGLARRPSLASGELVRALTQRGIVELELGRPEDAERSLRLAVSTWKQGSESERLDDYYPSQAQFYLGEVYRGHFQAVRLDPSKDGEARLAQDLEDKASLLLSAQGHYLRAIRMGHPDWAVAAGYRIGELYDAFHAALVEAPLPPGLDEEETAAYRAELKRKVRVLVTKAIAIYEQTLAVAGRARVENNRFVAETQASLDRMKRALRDVPPDAAPAPEPVLPKDAVPDKG
ncbi:MAG TPA: tetratricopeptide repeat protein [Anaeromyxobacteraceae bacterium]|nr:tetratricopeptide repeat protein [Anaeromyxobacteraceae bacterium]